MSSILIVENDPLISEIMALAVAQKGWEYYQVSSLRQSYRALEREKFDLVIIDRLLDDGDGLDLVQYLNHTTFQTKQLVVSHVAASRDRVQGLSEGADDYLAKPFLPAELTLKIEKLLHSLKLAREEELTLGPVSFFPATGTLKYLTITRQLRRREASIFTCLLRHKNQILTREQLVTYVWAGQELPLHTTLDVYVRRLRTILGPHHGLIKTIRGFGYSARDITAAAK